MRSNIFCKTKDTLSSNNIEFIWMITCCLLLSVLKANSQSIQNVTFSNSFELFSLKEGLSQSSALDIVTDHSGYIWVGTQDGLNRFDGYNFTAFRHDPDNSNSLSTNRINALYNDSKDRLWIGTISGGLCILDKTNGKFTRFLHNPGDSSSLWSNNVNAVIQDSNDNFWIGTDYGLNYIDGESMTLFRVPHLSKERDQNWITAIETGQKDYIWLATSKGLILFNTLNFEQRIYRYQENDTTSLSNDIILRLYKDKSDVLWVGTINGLNRFNNREDNFIRFLSDPKNPHSLSDDRIESIYEGDDGNFWLGTFVGGLNLMNRDNGTFISFQHESENEKSLATQWVRSITEDHSGHLWLGLWATGLSKMNREKENFQTFRHDHKTENSIRNKHVSGIFEDSKGLLWIATFGGGVSRWNRPTNQFVHYFHDPENENTLYSDRVFSLMEDSRGILWAGTQGGLNRFNIHRNNFDRQLELDDILFNIVWPIMEDSNGELWIGSVSNGLIHQDMDDNVQNHYKYDPNNPLSLSSNVVQCLLEDHRKNIWVGTLEAGLNYLDRSTQEFRHFLHNPDDQTTLSDDRVTGFLYDKNGNFWIATLSGLNLMQDFENGVFKRFGIKHGLPNDVIYCLLEDGNGHLWMSTNKGISRLNPITEEFTNFDVSDGLQDNEFNRCSCYKSPRTGEMFFGGINGFNIFHPEKITKKSFLPPVVITSLTLHNSTKEGVLPVIDHFVSIKNKIILDYNQSILSFQIAALSYQNTSKINYQYCLLGAFNDRWFDLGKKRNITFTNLSPGSYTLQIKSTNADGVWNEEPTVLDILITPPWYRTTLAYLFYLILVGTVGYLFYFFQKRRLILQTRLKYQETEARRLIELDRHKNNLFSNITHEFRTPLTVILGLADQLNKNPKFNLKSRVETIRRNGRKLLNLVNQMLELTRLQSGGTKVNYIQGDVMGFLNYLIESYQSFALANNRNLSFYSEPSSFVMDFDPDKMQRIIDNLLSNAIKFTPEYGRIRVIIKVFKGKILIEVSDNGIGIVKEKLPYIFDRFYQVDNSMTRYGEGTGIGLALVKELVDLFQGEIKVESEIKKGTSFFIYLPISRTAPIKESYPIQNYIYPEGISRYGEKDLEDQQLSLTNNKLPLLLIIEDNLDVVNYLKSCLRTNYNFIIARNGKEGVDKAFEHIPDIIISDVMMPEMDGYEVCEKLKTDVRCSHIPIILLTAKTSQTDRLKGLRKGADAYLSKPFVQEELFIRLEKLVELRRNMQQIYKHDEKRETIENTFLKNLNESILVNLDNEDFDVVRLCRMLGMSRTQLHRKIKALTSYSTSQYIREIRLVKAKQLLETSDENISEIAYSVGFKHPNNFSVAFKARFGILPNETRK